MTTVTDDQLNAGRVSADKLQAGTWLNDATFSAHPVRVTYASEPFAVPSSNYPRQVLIVADDRGTVGSVQVPADKMLIVATADEVDSEKATAAREAFARQLVAFADLILSNPALPIPDRELVMVNVHNREGLEAVSKLVGAPVRRSFGVRWEVEMPPAREDSKGVSVEWYANLDPTHPYVPGKGNMSHLCGERDEFGVCHASEDKHPKPKPAPPARAAVKRAPAVDKVAKVLITEHAFTGTGATCRKSIEGTGDSFIRCGATRDGHAS